MEVKTNKTDQEGMRPAKASSPAEFPPEAMLKTLIDPMGGTMKAALQEGAITGSLAREGFYSPPSGRRSRRCWPTRCLTTYGTDWIEAKGMAAKSEVQGYTIFQAFQDRGAKMGARRRG